MNNKATAANKEYIDTLFLSASSFNGVTGSILI